MAQSLTRIHVQVLLILCVCFAAIGYAVYLGARDLQQDFYHEQASNTVMQAADRINAHVEHQRQALTTAANQAAVLTTLQRGSPTELAQRAEEIKATLGAAWLVLVPWGREASPALDAVRLDYLRRQASAGMAVPEFHAIGSPGLHYLMAAPIRDAQRQPIGYALAGFTPEALHAILKQSTSSHAFLALQQTAAHSEPQIVLAVGEMTDEGSGLVMGELGAGHWSLLHQPALLPPPLFSGKRIYYAAVVAIAFIVVCFVVLRMSRRTVKALRHDIHSLIRMFRDLREGSVRVSYPMELREFNEIFDYLRDRGQKLVEEKEKLKDMGLIDHLSQLGNRRHFETRLKELFEASKANGPSSVLIIDMDHFKQVNDKHGHDAGDALIVAFANALRKVVRQTDVLCRLGGDEFCIIYTYAPLDKAATLVERLRRQLPREVPLTKGVTHQLRWTGGLSAMHDKDTKPDDVLWRADQALLQAKEAGRNITKLCDPVSGVTAKKTIMAS